MEAPTEQECVANGDIGGIGSRLGRRSEGRDPNRLGSVPAAGRPPQAAALKIRTRFDVGAQVHLLKGNSPALQPDVIVRPCLEETMTSPGIFRKQLFWKNNRQATSRATSFPWIRSGRWEEKLPKRMSQVATLSGGWY